MTKQRKIKMWLHRMPKHVKKRAIQNFSDNPIMNIVAADLRAVLWIFKTKSYCLGETNCRYWQRKYREYCIKQYNL